MSPWRAYLLMCMGLKAHQMDVETLARGKDRSEGLHRGRGGRSTRGSLADLYPGGLCPFHQDVGLGRFWEAVVCQVARVAASGGLMFCSRRPTLP
jgi:hypothetical protein